MPAIAAKITEVKEDNTLANSLPIIIPTANSKSAAKSERTMLYRIQHLLVQ